jgi:AcrR family transcriptional regulator
MSKSKEASAQPLRQQPQQARSRATIQHILDVAAQLYAEKGFEHVSTNHIAKQANVSVGGLYRFFPNKEAILSALTDRYIESLKSALPINNDVTQPMSEVVRTMIKNVLEFNQQFPMMKQIMNASHEGHVLQTAIQMHLTLKAWVEVTLQTYHSQLSREDRHLCAAAGMGIVKGMLGMMQPPDEIAPSQTVDEIVTALMAYVDAFVMRRE